METKIIGKKKVLLELYNDKSTSPLIKLQPIRITTTKKILSTIKKYKING